MLKRFKKLGAVALSFFVFFSLFLTNQTQIQADEPLNRTNVVVTDYSITTGSGAMGSTISQWDAFNLNISWDAATYGNTLKSGDYFIINLPSNLRFPYAATARNFSITDEAGNVVATGVVNTGENDTGGQCIVTFTDYVENRSNIHGTVSISSLFGRNVILDQVNTFTTEVNGQYYSVDVTPTSPVTVGTEEIINKWSQAVSDDYKARWIARINFGQYSNLTDVVITDSLSSEDGLEDMSYITDQVNGRNSFQLQEVTYDTAGNVTSYGSIVDISGRLSFNDDKTTFTLDLNGIDLSGKQYILTYYTSYIPGKMLRNSMTFSSTVKTASDTSTFKNAISGGKGDGDLNSKIQILKVDADNNQITLPGATFTITNTSTGETLEITTDENGEAITERLVPGEYTVEETQAPVGYDRDTKTYTVTVSAGSETAKTIENKKKTTSVSVEKKWVGRTGKSATVHLLANGVEVDSVTLNDDNDWKHTFKDVDEYANGELIEYTVVEDPQTGFVSEITGDATNGFTITNTDNSMDVSVQKKWSGDKTDSVTIHLLADGQEVDSVVLSADNDWKHTFKNVDKGVDYTITEDEIEGYSSEVSGNAQDGFVVTNTQTETDVKVTKKWNGTSTESVTIHLLADGQEVDSVTLNADNNWTHTFENVDINADYTITEDEIEGYTSTITGNVEDGFVVTNTQNEVLSDTIDIPVQKKWVGKTGSEAVIHVFANGTKVKEVTLTENNNWKYTFEDLPKYDENGLEIEYSIKEVAQAGYTTKIKKTKDGGYVVTNTRNGWIPTGLQNNMGLYIGGVLVSLAAILVILKIRRA